MKTHAEASDDTKETFVLRSNVPSFWNKTWFCWMSCKKPRELVPTLVCSYPLLLTDCVQSWCYNISCLLGWYRRNQNHCWGAWKSGVNTGPWNMQYMIISLDIIQDLPENTTGRNRDIYWKTMARSPSSERWDTLAWDTSTCISHQ